MKHIKRNLRAVSPVLAELMMIAVALAGSLLIYEWIVGLVGVKTETSGESIRIQNIANDPTNTDLLVHVQNVGEDSVRLDEDRCLYVDGLMVSCTISGVTVSDDVATLRHGQTATLRYAGGATLPGEKVKVKVTTLHGTSAVISNYPAGRARVETGGHVPMVERVAISIAD